MKYFTSFILFFCLLWGCNRQKKTENYPLWPKTHVEEADSLFPQLHDAFDNGKSDEIIVPIIEKLNYIAAQNGKNDLLYGAKKYWEARFLIRSGHLDEANSTLLDGLSRIDSVRYTYYYFKLHSLLERTLPTVFDRYRTGMQNLIYFRSVGDSLSVAHSLVTIGNLLRVVEQKEKALAAFEQAGKIWKDAGMERNYYGNQINVALCLDDRKADSLSNKLMENPHIMADTAAYTLLLRNMATSASEKKDSVNAYRLSKLGVDLIGNSRKYQANGAVLNSVLGIELLRKGDKKGALAAARKALETSDSPIEKYAEFEVLLLSSQIYGECGLPDSALLLLNRAMDIRSDNDFELNNITLGVEEARQSMMQLEFSNELNRVRAHLWLIIAISLLIIAIIISLLFYRKIQNRKFKEKIALEQLEDSKSKLARETLMFEQNENLISWLKAEIEKERDKGGISQSSASYLLSQLREQIADRGERQAFIDVHNHLLPGFSANLKNDYPDLTEHQIKLAAYIVSGMSNPLIAKLLNITPSSVRTLRYRMRSKFGLNRADSLEEFLRQYT